MLGMLAERLDCPLAKYWVDVVIGGANIELKLKVLRKIGWRRHDLTSMLAAVGVLLRVLTLNIDRRYQKRIPAVFYLFTMAYAASFVHEFVVSPVWFVFFRPGSKILEKLCNSATATGSYIGVVQFICMYWKREDIQSIVDAYLLCDRQVPPASRMGRSINATLRAVKKRAIMFWTIIMSNAFIYIFIPYAIPDRHLHNDYYVTYGLEPMYESPNFEVTRVVYVLSMMIVVTGPITITTFLIIVVGYTEAQMIALSHELTNLWKDAHIDYKLGNTIGSKSTNVQKEAIVNHYINSRLENIIKTHAINKRLIKQVEDVFKNPIALKFLILYVTLILDLLGGLENTYLIIPYPMMLVVMDCVTGQRLLDANVELEEAVYCCQWERFDARNMRLVLLLLMNAQKTTRLSAGGLPSLGYVTLLSIIRSVYSAYAAFRSIINKP